MSSKKLFFFCLLFVGLLAVQVGAGEQVQQKSIFTVERLSCGSCLATIEASLRPLAGYVGMDADIGRGLVGVVHEEGLAAGRIAETISAAGYPAALRQTVAAAGAERLGPAGAQAGRSCCPPAAGVGTQASIAPEPSSLPAVLDRTLFKVEGMTCISCLERIGASLRQLRGIYGMNGSLQRSMVAVDHLPGMPSAKIVAAIALAGYQAREIGFSAGIPGSKGFAFASAASRPQGGGCGSAGGCSAGGRSCSASASAWQALVSKFAAKNVQEIPPAK